MLAFGWEIIMQSKYNYKVLGNIYFKTLHRNKYIYAYLKDSFPYRKEFSSGNANYNVSIKTQR